MRTAATSTAVPWRARRVMSSRPITMRIRGHRSARRYRRSDETTFSSTRSAKMPITIRTTGQKKLR